MAEVAADVWVLTETHVEHVPGRDFAGVHSPPFEERRPKAERWVGIWTRWPIVELSDPAAHRRGSLAALIETPSGPIVVYGTVIPYANDPWLDGDSPARKWEAHLAAIDRQGAEWSQLRADRPGVPLIVAGDFNQTRDGSTYYGSQEVWSRLSARLDSAGLRCLTDTDVIAAGLLPSGHLVDHICASSEVAQVGKMHCWPAHDGSVRFSDHPTVAVDLGIKGSSYPSTR